jgi:hypothetical protein
VAGLRKVGIFRSHGLEVVAVLDLLLSVDGELLCPDGIDARERAVKCAGSGQSENCLLQLLGKLGTSGIRLGPLWIIELGSGASLC